MSCALLSPRSNECSSAFKNLFYVLLVPWRMECTGGMYILAILSACWLMATCIVYSSNICLCIYVRRPSPPVRRSCLRTVYPGKMEVVFFCFTLIS